MDPDKTMQLTHINNEIAERPVQLGICAGSWASSRATWHVLAGSIGVPVARFGAQDSQLGAQDGRLGVQPCPLAPKMANLASIARARSAGRSAERLGAPWLPRLAAGRPGWLDLRPWALLARPGWFDLASSCSIWVAWALWLARFGRSWLALAAQRLPHRHD